MVNKHNLKQYCHFSLSKRQHHVWIINTHNHKIQFHRTLRQTKQDYIVTYSAVLSAALFLGLKGVWGLWMRRVGGNIKDTTTGWFENLTIFRRSFQRNTMWIYTPDNKHSSETFKLLSGIAVKVVIGRFYTKRCLKRRLSKVQFHDSKNMGNVSSGKIWPILLFNKFFDCCKLIDYLLFLKVKLKCQT